MDGEDRKHKIEPLGELWDDLLEAQAKARGITPEEQMERILRARIDVYVKATPPYDEPDRFSQNRTKH